MITDTLFWRGLELIRTEPDHFIRARLLAIYAIKSAPGDMFEELLTESYDAVKLIDPRFRGAMLNEITLGLLAAGLL